MVSPPSTSRVMVFPVKVLTKMERQHQAILQKFNTMRQEYNALAQKIGEMELEKNEHELVINAIQNLNKDRKCYRLVGGVLVERTVGEVLPAVQKNRDNIVQTIQSLEKQLEEREKELNEFALKYKIALRKSDDENQPTEAPTESKLKSSTTGVLA
jgi:prefoldin subunit 2